MQASEFTLVEAERRICSRNELGVNDDRNALVPDTTWQGIKPNSTLSVFPNLTLADCVLL
jgi:hypothetical protein